MDKGDNMRKPPEEVLKMLTQMFGDIGKMSIIMDADPGMVTTHCNTDTVPQQKPRMKEGNIISVDFGNRRRI